MRVIWLSTVIRTKKNRTVKKAELQTLLDSLEKYLDRKGYKFHKPMANISSL
jgi:hypothetical protein